MIKPIQITSSIFKYKNNLFKTKSAKTILYTTTLPIVTTPILEYWSPKKDAEIRNNTINNEIQKSKSLNSSHHPVKDATEANTKALREAGYKDSEIAKSLNSKGEIKDDSIKKELKSKNIRFQGNSDDTQPIPQTLDDTLFEPQTMDDNIQNEPTGFWDSIKSKYQDVQNKFKKILGINNEPVAETTSVSDVNADIQLQQDLDWVNSINEKMCPECEEIYNAIPTEIPEGLMSNIMGDIPEGFMGDKDLLKMLKDMTKDFLGEQ